MSVCNSPESPFETDRFFKFTVNEESYRGSIHFSHCFSDNPDFVDENYTLYKIVEQEVYDDTEPHLVLQRETHQVSDMEVYDKNKIDNWTPVMAIK